MACYEGYDCTSFFCELMNGLEPDNPDLALIRERLSRMDLAELGRRAATAEAELYNLGITFTVYSDRQRHRPHPALRPDPARADRDASGTSSSAA